MSIINLNYPFPAFSLRISISSQAVIGAEFAQVSPLSAMLNGHDLLGYGPSKFQELDLWRQVIYQLDSYCRDPGFVFSLPLSFSGSLHQLKVWQLLRQIRSGSVLSYAAAAQLVNSSARAVGGACGRNPLPVFIPCQRIIAANGQLGGFNSGNNSFNLSIKQWLLQHEGILG